MLYIMRHGRTDWNDQMRLQGCTDIPLNEAGRAMAEKARKECWDVPLDICYSSPLVRAVETAEILLRGRNIPIITDPRLREMGFGIYEGLAEIFSIPDCPINAFFQHPEQYIGGIGGAETFEELFARTGEFLREVVDPLLSEGKNVLIVGHGAMNLSIINRIRELPLRDFWSPGIENCKLIRLI
ncbi:MAG: histidine phosphatase family protein [Lachnospiraceae bacterium]|nr:histidine phosphatase family protein [Lachnospiraceae bacterium]